METYAYYPGCSQIGTAIDYDMSVRACCKSLGVNLVELNDWSCCGSTPAHTISHLLSGALSARNLEIAHQQGQNYITTPCPSCLSNLRHASIDLDNPKKRELISTILGKPAVGKTDCKSILQILIEDVGLETIKTKIKQKFDGIKVATYYGCIMNRPADIMKFDNPENPVAMDKIMEAIGIEVVPFPLKVECCGAAYGIPAQKTVAKLSGKLLGLAKSLGANAVVTACPLCQMNLDLRQGQAERFYKTKFELPIFYFSQLLGFALGFSEKDLGMEKLFVSPDKVLSKILQEVV